MDRRQLCEPRLMLAYASLAMSSSFQIVRNGYENFEIRNPTSDQNLPLGTTWVRSKMSHLKT